MHFFTVRHRLSLYEQRPEEIYDPPSPENLSHSI